MQIPFDSLVALLGVDLKRCAKDRHSRVFTEYKNIYEGIMNKREKLETDRYQYMDGNYKIL